MTPEILQVIAQKRLPFPESPKDLRCLVRPVGQSRLDISKVRLGLAVLGSRSAELFHHHLPRSARKRQDAADARKLQTLHMETSGNLRYLTMHLPNICP